MMLHTASVFSDDGMWSNDTCLQSTLSGSLMGALQGDALPQLIAGFLKVLGCTCGLMRCCSRTLLPCQGMCALTKCCAPLVRSGLQ